MVRLNYRYIKNLCRNDPKCIIAFLRMCTGLRTKKVRRLSLIAGRGLPIGDSFMLDLLSLLEDKVSSVYDKVQYIELCCLRNYVNYKYENIISLPEILAFNTDVQHNRLLKIENRQILFKYEQRK